VVVERARRGTRIHGRGHDGVACYSGEVLAERFWLWQQAWKVVLGGMLLPLGEEDGGAPRWPFEGGRDGASIHTERKPLPGPYRCQQRCRHLLVLIALLKVLSW
jgi:hypothetical protein